MARQVRTANADHLPALQLDFIQRDIAERAHALNRAAREVVAVGRVLRGCANGFAFAGRVQVNLFRTQRDPDVGAMRVNVGVTYRKNPTVVKLS
jgi:hypothetical protein